MSNGVIVHKYAEKQIPLAYLKAVMKNNTAVGYALRLNAGLTTQPTPALTTPEQVFETQTKVPDHIIYSFAPESQFPKSDRLPVTVLYDSKDSPLVVAFITGAMPGFEKTDSSHDPAYNFCVDYLLPKLEEYWEMLGDIDKLYDKVMKSNSFKVDLINQIVGHGHITLMFKNGKHIDFGMPTEHAHEFDWGYTTNAMGFGSEAPPWEEPQNDPLAAPTKPADKKPDPATGLAALAEAPITTPSALIPAAAMTEFEEKKKEIQSKILQTPFKNFEEYFASLNIKKTEVPQQYKDMVKANPNDSDAWRLIKKWYQRNLGHNFNKFKDLLPIQTLEQRNPERQKWDELQAKIKQSREDARLAIKAIEPKGTMTAIGDALTSAASKLADMVKPDAKPIADTTSITDKNKSAASKLADLGGSSAEDKSKIAGWTTKYTDKNSQTIPDPEEQQAMENGLNRFTVAAGLPGVSTTYRVSRKAFKELLALDQDAAINLAMEWRFELIKSARSSTKNEITRQMEEVTKKLAALG
jgi:hypothetical protein